MRRPIVLAAVAIGMAVATWSAPSLAMQPPAEPPSVGTLVTRVADLGPQRKPRQARVHRGRGAAYWEYRLSASRWLAYHHANAGYPARRYRANTTYFYVREQACCGHRHWRWNGRRHRHGPRHWVWIGHRRCDRHW